MFLQSWSNNFELYQEGSSWEYYYSRTTLTFWSDGYTQIISYLLETALWTISFRRSHELSLDKTEENRRSQLVHKTLYFKWFELSFSKTATYNMMFQISCEGHNAGVQPYVPWQTFPINQTDLQISHKVTLEIICFVFYLLQLSLCLCVCEPVAHARLQVSCESALYMRTYGFESQDVWCKNKVLGKEKTKAQLLDKLSATFPQMCFISVKVQMILDAVWCQW